MYQHFCLLLTKRYHTKFSKDLENVNELVNEYTCSLKVDYFCKNTLILNEFNSIHNLNNLRILGLVTKFLKIHFIK